MTVHYGEINSDSGPFVFIRLLDSIEQKKYDVLGWAQRLSTTEFDGRPVAVANRNTEDREVLQVWPQEFASVLEHMSWAGIGLLPKRVEDLPLADPDAAPRH